MINPPSWLPDILRLCDFGGDWQKMLDAAYARFCDDLVFRKISLNGFDVAVRRHPVSNGKEFGFWHCVQEGAIESCRTPAMDRLERIAWIRAVIENANDCNVDYWRNIRGTEQCHLLWLAEEYLVVLGERLGKTQNKPYLLLKTAYCTDGNRTRERLRRERDAFHAPRQKN